MDDPFLPLAFSLTSSPRAYAVLAGAGVSTGAAVKSAWGIVVDLLQQIAQSRGEDPTAIHTTTTAHWYETRFGQEADYSTVVTQLGLTPIERQALLRGYFEPSGHSAEPSAAHRAVARLVKAGVINVILELNFDRLFEQALREIGIEPTVVASDDDAAGMPSLQTIHALVVHLHGDYLTPASMLNTTDELRKYKPHIADLVEGYSRTTVC